MAEGARQVADGQGGRTGRASTRLDVDPHHFHELGGGNADVLGSLAVGRLGACHGRLLARGLTGRLAGPVKGMAGGRRPWTGCPGGPPLSPQQRPGPPWADV